MRIHIHTFGILFYFLFAASATSCMIQEIQPDDRDLFVTIEEIEEYMDAYEYDTQPYESQEKTLWFDTTVDLSYEFETPDTDEENPLYLNTEINCSAKKADTSLDKLVSKGIITTFLEAANLKLKERNDIFKYKNSQLQMLLNENGNPVGNILYYSGNKCLYTFMISGLYIDDSEIWNEIVLPKLMKTDKIDIGFFELKHL